MLWPRAGRRQLDAEQAQRLAIYAAELVEEAINKRVAAILEAMGAGHDSYLDHEDAVITDDIAELWEKAGRRRAALDTLCERVVERVLAVRREAVAAQLDKLSIAEKQALFDQIGVVATWKAGEPRVKIAGNVFLEALLDENAPA